MCFMLQGPGCHHTGQQGRDYQGYRLILTPVSFFVLLLLLRAEQVNQDLESSASLGQLRIEHQSD